MFERERTDPRTDPQTDIEFDFFDESPTAETATREPSERRRRRLPTRPPSPPGGPQLYRLGILVAGLIVLAVILILTVNSCRADQKQAEYRDYMEAVGEVAGQSANLGAELNNRLTTPGIRLEALRRDVEGLAEQQDQILRRTQDLTPPGPLVEQQQSLLQTMQFRASGLDGLAAAFALAAQSTNVQESAGRLAQQSSRLISSDVVYDDLFKEPAADVLEAQEVTDVAVPDSNFIPSLDLVSPTAWELVVRRLTQPASAGGLHGNGIMEVRVQPGGETLSPDEDNTVLASDRLTFQVLVQNSGDNQETRVEVTLTIQQDPPIRKRQVIDIINPGQTKVVSFSDFGAISFETGTTLRVIVEPVPGEQNTANNTAEYPVLFSLTE
ncbi:MAG TPA: CARDB domain-containing protein [Gaiellaceae bacterium]|nr:CARDB domain-containing protein [Gaiellaceae bacterium]